MSPAITPFRTNGWILRRRPEGPPPQSLRGNYLPHPSPAAFGGTLPSPGRSSPHPSGVGGWGEALNFGFLPAIPLEVGRIGNPTCLAAFAAQ